MAYNHQKEEKKWRTQKRKEEEILRKYGISEKKIKELYDYDRKDFNRNRRFKEKEQITQDIFFIRQPVYDHLIVFKVEDLLDQIENKALFLKLKSSDPILKQIIFLRFMNYDIKEIARDLHMTPNAVRKRIYKFRKNL